MPFWLSYTAKIIIHRKQLIHPLLYEMSAKLWREFEIEVREWGGRAGDTDLLKWRGPETNDLFVHTLCLKFGMLKRGTVGTNEKVFEIKILF